MGKILEDIHLEFCSQFAPNETTLIGVQHEQQAPNNSPSGLRPSMFLQPNTRADEMNLSPLQNDSITMETEELNTARPVNFAANALAGH